MLIRPLASFIIVSRLMMIMNYKKREQSRKNLKWKYTKNARKKRYCQECDERLHKNEVFLCEKCFAELLPRTFEPEEHKDNDGEMEEE